MTAVTVKKLRWADDTKRQVTTQDDGQIQYYTECGRYIVRQRKGVVGTMYVARYLINHILAVLPSLDAAKEEAQKDHERRVLADIKLS